MHTNRSCPICGGVKVKEIESFIFTMPQEYPDMEIISLVECDTCGFVYKNILKDIHSEAKQTQEENRYESFEQDFTREYLKEEAEVILSNFGKEASILDIGCCTGYLLYYLSILGVKNCQGLEPSQVSCTKALEKGVSVRNGNVYDNIKEFENSFDVIVLSQVLEHITDLDTCINQLKKWLKKDGYIFISVPDEQHCHEYYGSLSSILTLEHVNHFGETSLDHLMIKHGFSLLSHRQRNYSSDIRNKEERSCIMASFDSVYQRVWDVTDKAHTFQKEGSVGKSVKNLLGQYREKKACIRQKAEKLQNSGSQFIIWGVSHMAMNLLHDELQNVNVVGFTDSDPSKYKLHIMGLPVISPSEIPGNNTAILIMDNNSKNSIMNSIKEKGLPNPVFII